MESFSPEVRVRPVLLVVGSRLGLAFLHTDVHKANPEPDLECRDGDGHSKSFFFRGHRVCGDTETSGDGHGMLERAPNKK